MNKDSPMKQEDPRDRMRKAHPFFLHIHEETAKVNTTIKQELKYKHIWDKEHILKRNFGCRSGVKF